MTEKFTPEEELAYECGYKNCCHNNNIPYVQVKRTWNNMMRFEVELCDKTLNTVGIEVIAKDIASRVISEYEKFKKNGNPDNLSQQLAECKYFDGINYKFSDYCNNTKRRTNNDGICDWELHQHDCPDFISKIEKY